MRGNCYVSSEALYHILGGKAAGWSVLRCRTKTDTHWFLQHRTGTILDPSVRQFTSRQRKGIKNLYRRAVKTGFLTKKPSKRAKALMEILTWQTEKQLKTAITDIAKEMHGS